MIATTVDAQGTRRAVTKLVGDNRLVSCTCCGGGITCCLLDTDLDLVLYPNGAITQAKLPPTIVLDGVTYSLGTLGYGNTTNGVFLESGEWAVYKSGNRTTRRCLVSNIATDIEDEFPDTLSLTYSAFGYTVTASLTRISLCTYEGTDSEGCEGSIINNSGSLVEASSGNNWLITGFTRIYSDGFFGCGNLQFTTTLERNTPTGTYSGEFAEDIDTGAVSITLTVTTP